MKSKRKSGLRLIKTNEIPLPDEAMINKKNKPTGNPESKIASGLLDFLDQLADSIEKDVKNLNNY